MDAERFAQAWVQGINHGDVEAITALCDPEIEVHIRELPTGGLWGSDFKPVYRGIEEALAAFEQWSEPWSELRLDIDAVVPESDDEFVLHAHWHGVGRGSGLELSTAYDARYTLRDDKVLRIVFIAPPE